MKLEIIQFYCQVAIERGKATFATSHGQLVRLVYNSRSGHLYAKIMDDSGEYYMNSPQATFANTLYEALGN